MSNWSIFKNRDIFALRESFSGHRDKASKTGTSGHLGYVAKMACFLLSVFLDLALLNKMCSKLFVPNTWVISTLDAIFRI
jgi:hypothetical protein